MELHDQVLRDNGASWSSPPVRDCTWSPQRLNDLRTIIRQYPMDRPWAIKDPRTCFTLSGWLGEIPRLRFIATFRHPAAVAASLSRRNADMAIEAATDLWCRYNRRLIELHEEHKFPVVCFDVDPDAYLTQISSAFRSLDLDFDPSQAAFFSRDLIHQHAAGIPVHEGRSRSIYKTLLKFVA